MLLREHLTRATFFADLALLVALYVRGWYDFYAVALPIFNLKFGRVTAQKITSKPVYRILHGILRISMYYTPIPYHSGFCDMAGQR